MCGLLPSLESKICLVGGLVRNSTGQQPFLLNFAVSAERL